MSRVTEYSKLMRLKAMGVSNVAVFGALSVTGLLELHHFLLLFFIGVAFNILGFVLNDYFDIEIDRKSEDLAERPLVKGTVSSRSALRIALFLYVVIFTLALIFFRDLVSLSMLMLAVILGTVYDCYGKSFLVSEIILAGAMALFCLFGAFTVSSKLGLLTWIIVFLVFIHVIFFIVVEGGLKDADNDRKSASKTAAVYLGVKTKPDIYIPISFKALAISVESCAAIIVFLPFLIIPEMYNFEFWYIQVIVLLLITGSLFVTMIRMLNMKSFDRENIRNEIVKQEAKRYIIAVIILMGVTGFLWPFILILMPFIWAFVWFLIFKFIFHEKLPRVSRLL